MAVAAAVASAHEACAPSSPPRRRPCHFSGSRHCIPAEMSYVLVSPRARSASAAAELPAMSKPRWSPISSIIVFSMFILWFDIASKRLRVSRRWGTELASRTATIVSSTSPLSLSTGPSAVICPSRSGIGTPLMLALSLIILSCTSCTSTYNSGLSGHPCFTDAVRPNAGPTSPLTFTLVFAPRYSVFTAAMRSGGRLNASSVSHMNWCCSLSKAFSLSRNSSIPPSAGLLLFTSCMVSRTIDTFSSYKRPGQKPTCVSPTRCVTAQLRRCAMHFARILYASVVTDTGRYLVGSVRSPLSLYSGDSTALSIVSVSCPLCRSWAYSALSAGAMLSMWTRYSSNGMPSTPAVLPLASDVIAAFMFSSDIMFATRKPDFTNSGKLLAVSREMRPRTSVASARASSVGRRTVARFPL